MTDIWRTLYFWGLLAYLAILPVAHTLALRSLLSLLLVAVLIVSVLRKGWRESLSWEAWSLPACLPVLLWTAYLCFFPLLAEQAAPAWSNLRGQWGQSILAWLIGWGGVLLMGRNGPSLLRLALASGFLVLLHLGMSLMAWSGLLGVAVPADMPLIKMWHSFLSVVARTSEEGWRWQPFPWGFRGFDPMHGNLGYTSNQAIILLLCCLLFAWRSQLARVTGIAAAAIVLCFFSVVVAYSRGAVLYGLLMAVLAGLVYKLRLRGPVSEGPSTSRPVWRKGQLVLVWAVLPCLLVAYGLSLKKDQRWHLMVDNARVVFFLVDDPVRFLCEGPDESMLQGLREEMQDRGPVYVSDLTSGLYGDGARVALMRAGLVLVAERPWGLDGSRDSYKQLIETKCGHRPKMLYAHAHQGWLDTTLALGWVGGGLLGLAFLSLAVFGWRNLRPDSAGPWAMALLLLSVYWITRGFADSVYREHLLQMQAVLLGYLAARTNLERQSAAEQHQSGAPCGRIKRDT
jgi:hypothetical protein